MRVCWKWTKRHASPAGQLGKEAPTEVGPIGNIYTICVMKQLACDFVLFVLKDWIMATEPEEATNIPLLLVSEDSPKLKWCRLALRLRPQQGLLVRQD